MIAGTMPPRRARVEERKITVCGKITPAVSEALENTRQAMEKEAAPAKITMSQLVEHAIKEFLDRRSRQESRKPQK